MAIALVAVLLASGFVGLGRLSPVQYSFAQDDPSASPHGAAPPESPIPLLMETGVVNALNFNGIDYYLYIPNSARSGQPITVLAAFRGVGDNADEFAQGLAPQAEMNGWVLVVPKFNYGDWKQIETLKADGKSNFPWLKSLLDTLSTQTGLTVRDKLLLYGFSRGGQAAHRFALLYPDKVMAVASMSAGSYTLPSACVPDSDNQAPLDFPLGVADINSYCGKRFDPEAVKKIPFLIGVGDKDTASGDVPQDFTTYIGTNRVERAKAFAKAIANLGAKEELVIFPNLGHGETNESRTGAMAFLEKAEMDQLAEVAANQQTDPGQPAAGS